MEIRIILDDRIVNGARRVFSRSGLAALTAVALLAGGAALVAQEANDASNVFSPGEVISSAAVNQNFQELHDLAQAQDEEIAEKVSGFDLEFHDTLVSGSSTGPLTKTATADLCFLAHNYSDDMEWENPNSGNQKLGCRTTLSAGLWYMDAWKPTGVGGNQWCAWNCVTFN